MARGHTFYRNVWTFDTGNLGLLESSEFKEEVNLHCACYSYRLIKRAAHQIPGSVASNRDHCGHRSMIRQ